MIHLPNSPHNKEIASSPRASLEVESYSPTSSPTPVDINLSLPRSGPEVGIDLKRFRCALKRLPVGELHEACRQRSLELEKGTASITYAQLEAVSAKLEALSEEQRTTLVHSFFRAHQDNPILCPFPGYHETVINAGTLLDEGTCPSKAMARSILERGMPPFDDIKAVALGVSHSLLDRQRDTFLSWATIAAGAIFLATASTLSAPTIITASVIVLCAFRYLAARPHPHNEVCAGYVREHLDLVDAILNYEHGVSQLGARLNIHYNNPSDADNYGSLWRASGFLLARAARIVGASTTEIEKEFRKIQSIEELSELLTEKINAALTAQEVTPPPSLLTPFLEEGPLTKEREQYFGSIEEMNYCYISWAASETHVLRRLFAEAILSFDKEAK